MKTNTSFAILTGGCNEGPPKPPAATEEYLAIASIFSAETGSIGIVIYQIPNCAPPAPALRARPPTLMPPSRPSAERLCRSRAIPPAGKIVYPSDPARRPRDEDAMIAWAWRQYLLAPNASRDPRWLPRFPMVKAGMQCMRASTEYLAKADIAKVDGWVVGGASKRGWTSWMVGAVDCPTCVPIVGLFPLVPIVPQLRASVHLQRRSLGGFTFAFRDYLDAGILPLMDSDAFSGLLDLVDPAAAR